MVAIRASLRQPGELIASFITTNPSCYFFSTPSIMGEHNKSEAYVGDLEQQLSWASQELVSSLQRMSGD